MNITRKYSIGVKRRPSRAGEYSSSGGHDICILLMPFFDVHDGESATIAAGFGSAGPHLIRWCDFPTPTSASRRRPSGRH